MRKNDKNVHICINKKKERQICRSRKQGKEKKKFRGKRRKKKVKEKVQEDIITIK